MATRNPDFDWEVSYNGILKLAQLVTADPVALEKWDVIMCHLIKSSAFISDVRGCRIEERVLKTLQLWKSENGKAASLECLLHTLRDTFQLINLADKIQGAAVSIQTGGTSTTETTVVVNSIQALPKCQENTQTFNVEALGTAESSNYEPNNLKLTAVEGEALYPEQRRKPRLKILLFLSLLSCVFAVLLLVTTALLVDQYRRTAQWYNNRNELVQLPVSAIASGVLSLIAGVIQIGVGFFGALDKYVFPTHGRSWSSGHFLLFILMLAPVIIIHFITHTDFHVQFPVHENTVWVFLAAVLADSVFLLISSTFVWAKSTSDLKLISGLLRRIFWE